jgi:hypothetical protein
MYQDMIRAALARQGLSATGVKPHHVEAWMRSERPTLDHLTPTEFEIEVRAAAACALTAGAEMNERLASSFGLAA